MRKTTTNNSLFLFSCGGARHLHTFATRATWTWLRRLFLGAQGSCNLQLPQFWLNILIHPTLTHPPLPPSSCFYYFKLECTLCIVLSVFGCVRFWRRAAVARIYVVFIFIPELWMLCIRTTSKKIQESIFGQILCQQNFSSTSLVVFIIGQLSLCPVTTFQDFINFIFRNPNTFSSYLIMIESESCKRLVWFYLNCYDC